MKKIGRPTILERNGITLDQIVEKFKELGSVRRTARFFDVSQQSIRTYLQKWPGELDGYRMRGEKRSRHYSCLAKWLRAHPDAKLPTSVKEISEITNCSENEIKTYLYRRRKRMRDEIEKVDLMKRPYRVLHDVTGWSFPTAAIAHYEAKLDPISLLVKISLKSRSGGEHRMRVEFTEFVGK